MKRRVDLVLDGDGDVIMIRVDHHSGVGGRDVMVDWKGQTVTKGTHVVPLTYEFPAKTEQRGGRARRSSVAPRT